MPQDPTRPIVHAVDRLTAQMKRIADLLDTPAEEVDAPLPPDNGARIVPRVMLPGAEEHAQAFQQWLHNAVDVRAATENMNALNRVRALHVRVTVQTTTGPAYACESCETDSMSYPWPCPTAEALGLP
ncbi:hypothetical protein ACIGNW_00165 [Streptomyces sp. NPDC053707]|uniref:hypothetical protein n=1 Tax=Streptomyces sp. NPDC053707 TaxID=3365712 RepID=UPI0037D34241